MNRRTLLKTLAALGTTMLGTTVTLARTRAAPPVMPPPVDDPGLIKIFADPCCPSDRLYFIDAAHFQSWGVQEITALRGLSPDQIVMIHDGSKFVGSSIEEKFRKGADGPPLIS